jgi:glycosyltransferase involved in cell wall biosynthesis
VKRSVSAVEILARVVRDRPAVLLMVGDGPDRAACEARARELGVRDRVRFVGAQAEVESLQPLADLFLLPSEYESFGLAALEAMACGTPTVAFAAGGLPEVIEDRVDGRLLPPHDDLAMGDAVRLLRDDPLRAAMGAAARASAERRFALDRVVPAYEAVYARAVATVAARCSPGG